MVQVKILEIYRQELDPALFIGYGIDEPRLGEEIDSYSFLVKGWVLGNRLTIKEVKLVCENIILQSTQVDKPRPDVAQQYPKSLNSEKSGFSVAISVLGLPPISEVFLYAVLPNEIHICLGIFHIWHKALESSYQPQLFPVVVTSLGRTGSTLLMRLLSEHTSIAASAEYGYETRAANYWLHMLQVLSQPADCLENPDQVDSFINDLKSVKKHPSSDPRLTVDPQLLAWFGYEYPQRLAAFCQENIDRFYQVVIAGQQKYSNPQRAVMLFAEKALPKSVVWLMREIYPKSYEIFLVRDFRDVACSIIAFNTKRGDIRFGREEVANDSEFVVLLSEHAKELLRDWKQRQSTAHLIRYEDLVLNPVPTLSSLFKYLEIDSSHAEVNRLLNKALQDTPEMIFHRTSSSIESSVGRWQHEMDEQMQKLCNKVFEDVLVEFGYSIK